MMRTFTLVVLLSLVSLAPAADNPPNARAAEQAGEQAKLDPADMKQLAQAIGAKEGQTVNQKVHILSIPRTDLDVRTLDFGEVPAEAGLTTTIRLWRCACGKYYLTGEYIVTDFESNDVIDSLREGNFMIASVAPILVRERPRILSIRFQGEGEIEAIGKTLKEAQRWVGDNRTHKNPIE